MSLQTPEKIAPSEAKELCDLHPLVIARVVCEWARIDREFPMQMWGFQYLGTHITVELDRYYIAYNAQQADVFIAITLEMAALGSKGGQVTWHVSRDELRERGCHARLERVS